MLPPLSFFPALGDSPPTPQPRVKIRQGKGDRPGIWGAATGLKKDTGLRWKHPAASPLPGSLSVSGLPSKKELMTPNRRNRAEEG